MCVGVVYVVIDESKLMMIIFTMINNRNTDNNLAKRNSTE